MDTTTLANAAAHEAAMIATRLDATAWPDADRAFAAPADQTTCGGAWRREPPPEQGG